MFYLKNNFLLFSFLTLTSALITQPIHAGKNNKAPITPDPAVFSQSADIDYPGLQKHLQYKFKSPDLLRDALHPMLPKRLGSIKQNHGHLEFLGDGILSAIIRDRLVDLLSNFARGDIVKICSSLAENKTLTDIFFSNLNIERYLPCPDLNATYEACNVVEALIGAVKKDDPEKGMNNAEALVHLMIDNQVFAEKINALSPGAHMSSPAMLLPEQLSAVAKICTAERVKTESPKTLLNEVLLGFHDARPTYVVYPKKSDHSVILYRSRVSGPWIGNNKYKGFGLTIKESEENAARNAINALSMQELYKISPITHSEYDSKTQLTELFRFLKVVVKSDCDTLENKLFQFKFSFDGKVIGQGEGRTKRDAEQIAAAAACDYLVADATQKRKTYSQKRDEQSANARLKLQAKAASHPENKGIKNPSDVAIKQVPVPEVQLEAEIGIGSSNTPAVAPQNDEEKVPSLKAKKGKKTQAKTAVPAQAKMPKGGGVKSLAVKQVNVPEMKPKAEAGVNSSSAPAAASQNDEEKEPVSKAKKSKKKLKEKMPKLPTKKAALKTT